MFYDHFSKFFLIVNCFVPEKSLEIVVVVFVMSFWIKEIEIKINCKSHETF